jgi:hypothetical protein
VSRIGWSIVLVALAVCLLLAARVVANHTRMDCAIAIIENRTCTGAIATLALDIAALASAGTGVGVWFFKR